MASGFSQDSIADFLRQRGGTVTSPELLEHFKAVFPQEPHSRAAVRSIFKSCVDSVAFVKTDSGVKHVCLRRQFRYCAASPSPDDQVSRDDAAASAQVQQKSARDSGYGNDWRTVPHIITAESDQPDKPEQDCGHQGLLGVLDEVAGSSAYMGNSGSFSTQRKDSRKEKVEKLAIPQITVIQASPLPVDGSVFILPGPECSAAAADIHTDWTPEGLKEEEQQDPASKQTFLSTKEDSEDKEDERSSLSGSEDSCSPKGSRKHFIQVMMNSSPEVRNSIDLRSPICLTPRSDGDSASVGSASLDVDRTSVTLDPAEHEWMMCASDAEWDSLHALLSSEPNLVLKKDFVTGFTCLHWAAKHGKQELIALIINFAKHHNLPISVDVRSNMGYTPLHIAAIHNHMEVLKLLVGAYNADVEIRDYSGRKACHYLTNNVSVDIRDIIGAYELAESKGAEPRVGGRWRFSKVLQNNLKPIHRLSLGDSDLMGGEDHLRSKPVRRRSSLSRMKPNLQKIRQRASQLVHSTSFRDKRELDESEEKPSRSRPKTHFLG
ncbi:ankyrin repeat domain-containing protein SOWAHC-like [Xiphophorus hellerii]|uniref:ankyrin repeat domain-containing protein SOWAHC-like n=1 Tax=Xiphophorus hellerii TaxID=8084 RepID=UPI0013B457F0|nr:ankyrin repeat domain-containing protein SOWAHC-like [Xiphophorus hellerii]